MRNIEVKLLNPEAINEGIKMAVFGARLTQHSHKIKNLDDALKLYNKTYADDFVKTLVKLPHPTLQKFSAINIIIVGASRRFLAQITRHQNEVKFMSGSLQYSDYTNHANFVVPYKLLDTPYQADYLSKCHEAAEEYGYLTVNSDNDTAGFIMPQGMRNMLLISATPYQWKHMIKQRICRRNSDETRYVMLLCWKELMRHTDTSFFNDCLPDCCKEGKFSCGRPLDKMTPDMIIKTDFPKLVKEEEYGV